MVVLHEREIRKAKNNFSMLTNADKRQSFMDDLSELVEQSPFSIIGSIVRKDENKRRKKNPTNPYELSIKYVLQILYKFLKERNQNYFRTYLVFESRGKKEDKELKNIFTQVCFFQNIQKVIPFEIIFASKYTNSCGLQLADLVARPIGRQILERNQTNRAYSILKNKVYNLGEIHEGTMILKLPREAN